MHHIQLIVLGMYIASMKVQNICSTDKVFAIAGCNVTLEWILGYSKEETDTTSITVFNTRGITIAKVEDMECEYVNNSAVHCEIMYREKQCFLSVVLVVNITQGNSENFTGIIKSGDGRELNITKQLIVIDKPQITTIQKPTLHEPLNITCTIAGKLQGTNYRWKLNGSYLNSTGRICARSAILTIENVTMEDKLNMLSCEVCTECSFCVDSETYAPDPYYGPYNVTLSPKESNIYLKENDKFRLKCSAECNPNCTFMWDGYIKSKNYELVIGSFDSRMTGEYICIAKNQETNITAKSYSIVLHLLKDPQQILLGIGLVIGAVFLVIVGFAILITLRGSLTMHRPCAGQVNNEACKEVLRFEKQNRPLPIPTMQENARRSIKRSNYPNIHRKSKSLHQLLDHNQDFWIPVRNTFSLQTLIELSQTTGRRASRDDCGVSMYSFKKNSWSCMEGPANSIKLDEMYSKDRKGKKVSNVEQSTSSKSPSLNISRHGSLDQDHQEDLYNTIDEAALFVYDYAIDIEHRENLQVVRRNAGAGNYKYDHAILPGL